VVLPLGQFHQTALRCGLPAMASALTDWVSDSQMIPGTKLHPNGISITSRLHRQQLWTSTITTSTEPLRASLLVSQGTIQRGLRYSSASSSSYPRTRRGILCKNLLSVVPEHSCAGSMIMLDQRVSEPTSMLMSRVSGSMRQCRTRQWQVFIAVETGADAVVQTFAWHIKRTIDDLLVPPSQ